MMILALKQIKILLFFVPVFLGLLFATTHIAHGYVPFGGQITQVDYYSCACSGGVLITVGPPVPAYEIVVNAATAVYPYGQFFRVGPWSLGLYIPGGVCLTPGYPSCTTKAVGGQVFMIGTSM